MTRPSAPRKPTGWPFRASSDQCDPRGSTVSTLDVVARFMPRRRPAADSTYRHPAHFSGTDARAITASGSYGNGEGSGRGDSGTLGHGGRKQDRSIDPAAAPAGLRALSDQTWDGGCECSRSERCCSGSDRRRGGCGAGSSEAPKCPAWRFTCLMSRFAASTGQLEASVPRWARISVRHQRTILSSRRSSGSDSGAAHQAMASSTRCAARFSSSERYTSRTFPLATQRSLTASSGSPASRAACRRCHRVWSTRSAPSSNSLRTSLSGSP